jgi:RNA polymerase sigma factor (sigma-70 family)
LPLPGQVGPDISAEVWSALAALPARQRAAVVLRYVEDLSERDIAAVLKCRPGTVKSMLSRARDVLRKELSDDQD